MFFRLTFFACLALLACTLILFGNVNSLGQNQARNRIVEQSSKKPQESTNPILRQNLSSMLIRPFQDTILGPRNRVVLCLGVDARNGERARSDTILLTVLRPKEQRLTTISIPRDTYIFIPSNGMTKINHAMVYGGVPLVKQTIERWLNIRIDNYATVNFTGLRTLVDQLGGVDLKVDTDMDYVDPTDSTSIHLKAGYQHLDGKQALDYARFRHDAMADTGRMRRQQLLVRAMMHTGLKMENWPKLMANMGVLRDHVNTDLSPLELIYLAQQYASIRPNSVDSLTVKGVNRIDPNDQIWYFYPESNEANRIAQLIKNQISS